MLQLETKTSSSRGNVYGSDIALFYNPNSKTPVSLLGPARHLAAPDLMSVQVSFILLQERMVSTPEATQK